MFKSILAGCVLSAALAMPALADVALTLALLAAFASVAMARSAPWRADRREPPP